ncbi:MAG: extracellular solute-binding protein [Porticoccaceae bacterium]
MANLSRYSALLLLSVILSAGAAVLLWLGQVGPQQSPQVNNTEGERRLNIYNWADYIDPQTLVDFEQEYGIQVNYDIYDSSEMVDAKLLTGRSGYDIVVHAASFTARFKDIDILHSLDTSRLSNWHYLEPALMETLDRQYSSGLMGSPFFWGTTGFTYNVDEIKARMPDAPLDSAAMFFDPEIISQFADCGVSMLDDPLTVIPLAMMYLGYPANSVDLDQLAEVEQLVKSVRPYIKYFSSTKMLLDLPSKEVCMAMSWSGDYGVAAGRAAEAGIDINLAYTIPKEGSVIWFDNINIPSDAPHRDNAYLFVDYMLRPEVIARSTNYIGYANANKDAINFVQPRIAQDTAIYPDQLVLQRMQTTEVLTPKMERRRSRTWTKIKMGRGKN